MHDIMLHTHTHDMETMYTLYIFFHTMIPLRKHIYLDDPICICTLLQPHGEEKGRRAGEMAREAVIERTWLSSAPNSAFLAVISQIAANLCGTIYCYNISFTHNLSGCSRRRASSCDDLVASVASISSNTDHTETRTCEESSDCSQVRRDMVDKWSAEKTVHGMRSISPFTGHPQGWYGRKFF